MTAFTAEHEPVAGNVITSRFLGEVIKDPASELFLPTGLPGFEDEHILLPIEIPAHRPLVFLQSTRSPDVCLVCLPVSCITEKFEIHIAEDDRLGLGLDLDRSLVMGEDILCLALLLPAGESVRTNLDAPIVINLRNYRCGQILLDSRNGSRLLTAEGNWQPVC